MDHDTTKSARRRKPDHAKIQIKGSWTAIPNRMLTDHRLSRDARLLGCLIFMHAANSGKAFPGQEDLAEELSFTAKVVTTDPQTKEKQNSYAERAITIRSVQRWLTELREAGWLQWRQTLKNNEYTLRDPTERATDENDALSFSSLNNRLNGTTAVSSGATEGSHGDATERSSRATQESCSDLILGSAQATQGSAPPTAVSCSTLLHEDSLYIDSSSSDSMPTTHPDDGDDDLVVAFLYAAGVTAAQEFRGLDLTAVQERVAMLQRDPNCRPGAIVKSLRASPPRPSLAMGSPAYIDQLNAKYGDLFRSGSDVSGLLPEDQDLHLGEEWAPNARPKKPDRA